MKEQCYNVRIHKNVDGVFYFDPTTDMMLRSKKIGDNYQWIAASQSDMAKLADILFAERNNKGPFTTRGKKKT